MLWSCFLSCEVVSTFFPFLQRWDGQKLLTDIRAISKIYHIIQINMVIEKERDTQDDSQVQA